MRSSEAAVGRVFVLRLEDGDRLPESIERLAREKGVERAACLLLGGADDGSRIVVGPEDGRALPPVPMVHTLRGVSEAAGVGTIFPDEKGEPVLHLHAAFGRAGQAAAGCVRAGVDIWKVAEVILIELTGSGARRARDPATGFSLLEP